VWHKSWACPPPPMVWLRDKGDARPSGDALANAVIVQGLSTKAPALAWPSVENLAQLEKAWGRRAAVRRCSPWSKGGITGAEFYRGHSSMARRCRLSACAHRTRFYDYDASTLNNEYPVHLPDAG